MGRNSRLRLQQREQRLADRGEEYLKSLKQRYPANGIWRCHWEEYGTYDDLEGALSMTGSYAFIEKMLEDGIDPLLILDTEEEEPLRQKYESQIRAQCLFKGEASGEDWGIWFVDTSV